MKQEDYNPNVEVFRAKNEDIRETAVTQCREHSWTILSEMEVACTKCPTVHIVKNAKEYVSTK